MEPLISVIMSSYNDEATISASIDSILKQSITDFEFIIIDDCSTDSTPNIIQSFNDDRIRFYKNNANKGLGYNLNMGISLSRGKYVARMDADDISKINRFKVQLSYLYNHPDVLCVGTSSIKFGDVPLRTKYLCSRMRVATNYEDLKVRMLIGTPILHPSVMFNGTILRNNRINYDPTFRRAQDYELWSRIIWDYKIVNLKTPLIYYRYSPSQASQKGREEQINNSREIYKRVLNKALNKDVTNDEIDTHIILSTKIQEKEWEMDKVCNWIMEMRRHVKEGAMIDIVLFDSFMSIRWAAICRESCPFLKRLSFYNKLPFAQKHLLRNVLRLYL